MPFNKRIINASESAPPSPDPVGVPVGATYFGYGTFFRASKILNFGWSGTAIYDRVGDTTTTGGYIIKGVGMSTAYDITTLSGTEVFYNVESGGSGQYDALVMQYSESGGYYVHDSTVMRSFDPNSAYAPAYFGGSSAYNMYFHDSGKYVIGSSTSGGQKVWRREYPAGSYDNNSIKPDSTTNINWDVTSLLPSGQTSPLSLSVFNQGNNFVLIDVVNSLLKIYSLATPYDFTSWTFVRDIAIPTSDTTIVGTQARINCHSMGGSLFVNRLGQTRVHQFQWVF